MFPSVILDTDSLCPFSFFNLFGQRFIIFLHLYKESAFSFIIFSIVFIFCFIHFCFQLYDFLSSAYFRLNLLFLFRSLLWWKLILLILNLYSFLMQLFNAINMPCFRWIPQILEGYVLMLSSNHFLISLIFFDPCDFRSVIFIIQRVAGFFFPICY